MQIGVTIAVAGCMKSGKTEQLILAGRRCHYAKYPFYYFTHSFDKERRKNLTVENHVVSEDHGSINIKEQFFTNTADLEYLLQFPRGVFGFNDIQFVDDPFIEFVETLASRGHIAVSAGLDNTSEHNHFPLRTPGGARDSFSKKTMYDLIGRSNEIIKLHAVCMYSKDNTCGNPAHYSRFLGDSKGVIKTGSQEYEPRCGLHKDV
jgi:thymidine kinase